MNARRIITPTFTVSDDCTNHLDILLACQLTIRAVRFDATALPIDELTFDASYAGVKLVVDMFVPDRDKPGSVEKIHIWRTAMIPWDPIISNGADYLVRWMRETIASTLAHEVDESITLDGARVFDPHRPFGGAA